MSIFFKALMIFLLLISLGGGAVAFSMVNLFHTQKIVQLRELTSAQAMLTATEIEGLVAGSLERLRSLSRIMVSSQLLHEQRSQLLSELFEDFEDVIAVAQFEGNSEKALVYETASFESLAGGGADLVSFRRQHPLPDSFFASGQPYIETSNPSDGLPTLTLSILQASGAEKPPLVISATVRLERLLRSAGGPLRVDDIFLLDAKGRLLAQGDPGSWDPDLVELHRPESGLEMVQTMEYTVGKEPMIGAFVRSSGAKILVGAQIRKSAAYLSSGELLTSLLPGALGMLVVSVLASLFWSGYITRSLERLTAATRRIAQGQFEGPIRLDSRDEFNDLAAAFNQMAVELNRRETGLRQAQTQLMQSEKLAAFGQLASGIAHEVKNPLAGVLGFAQLALRKAEAETPQHKYLSIIEKEAKRCQNIIEGLMTFARKEDVEGQPTDINAVIEDVVSSSEKELGLSQVRIEQKLMPGLPRFMGNPKQMSQVLMQLILNAQQAMGKEPSTIRLSSGLLDSGQIEVRVADKGPGMSQEVKDKLFEPFFTTRLSGEGTGLGLSVSLKNIQDHQGTIRVESEPGEGATFIITLPTLGENGTKAEGFKAAAC